MKIHCRLVERAAAVGLLIAAPLMGCDSSTDLAGQLGPCEEPDEFGSAGCAVVQLQIEEPEGLTIPWLLTVSARWPGGGLIAHADEPRFGSFIMRLDLLPPSPVQGGDTASAWFTAKVVDVEESTDGTTEYLAADSVIAVLYFSSIGENPQLETVRLRPSPIHDGSQ